MHVIITYILEATGHNLIKEKYNKKEMQQIEALIKQMNISLQCI